MSENIGRVLEAVGKVNTARKDTFVSMGEPDALHSAASQFRGNDVFRPFIGEFTKDKLKDKGESENLTPDKLVMQQPTVKDVLYRMGDVKKELSENVEAKAKSALEKWQHCENKADEVGAETPEQALVISERVVKSHAEIKQHQAELATKIIDSMQKEGFEGPTAKLIDLTVESYVLDMSAEARGNLDANAVSVKTLKEDPRFQEYRNAIVRKVQSLAESTKPIAMAPDLKGKVKNLWNAGFKNIWTRASVAAKFGFDSEARREYFAILDSAQDLTSAQEHIIDLPSLEISENFLSSFGAFQREAQMTINSNAVLEAMPIVQEKLVKQHAQSLSDLIVEAYDENDYSLDDFNDALNENDAIDAESLKVERQKINAAREAASLDIIQRYAIQGMIEAKVQYLKDSEARDEFADLELKANQLMQSADHHAELASMGLTVLHELQFSEKKIAEFNESFSAEKMPDSLAALVDGDMAKELQEFVESNGKRGSDKAIRRLLVGTKSQNVSVDPSKKFFGNEKEVGYRGILEEVMFDPNNKDHFLTLNTLTTEANTANVVETGIKTAVAEDGTWQLRFATRKDGKVEVNENIPVVNLKPESLFAALSTIDAQEASLRDAQKALSVHQDRYDTAVAIKATSAEARRTAKGLLASSQSRVDELNKSLTVSRAALAKELKVTNTGSSLAEAFNEMVEAQREVAQEFYSADFREMVSDLAKELNMPKDKVTAEVLATLVVEATSASEQASQMAEFFSVARTPGALESRVVKEHMGEIEALSELFAKNYRNEQLVSQLDPGIAKDKAAKEYAKERRALNDESNRLGIVLKEAFIEAVPAPLRKGTKATVISPNKFKKQVMETLDSASLPSELSKRDEILVDRVRAVLPFNRNLQILTTQAADALVGIEDSEVRKTLLNALDEGDVQEFNERVNKLTTHLTVEKLSASQAEADRAKLLEQLSTPEGVKKLMGTSEDGWRAAVKAADENPAIGGPVYKALLEDQAEGALIVKLEAAKRLGESINSKLVELGNPAMWGENNPIAGDNDLAEKINFIDRATNQAQHGYWEFYLQKIAEKKTPIVPNVG